MAVCLDYQRVYVRTRSRFAPSKTLEIVAAAALLAVLSVRIWIRSEVTELGYRFSTLRSETTTLDMERQELQLQLEVMSRPDTLAARARKELGFQELKPQQIVRVQY